MSAWSSNVNDNVQLKDFTQELSVDYKSLGSWKADYEHFSAKLGISPCPSFSVTPLEDGKCSCKVANRIIDIASWRSFLLACSANGSSVSEIAIHNCQLSALHFTDLCLALEKLGKLDVLKLDYIEVISILPVILSTQPVVTSKNPQAQPKKRASTKIDIDEGPIHLTVFGHIFTCNCTINYISLRGNLFTDEFITLMQPVLSNNVTIQSLSLSDNLLTDNGITRLFQILKVHSSIRHISLRKNTCNGTCLEMLAALITGTPVTPEDDQILKTVVKIVAEKNKSIKEVNKKRKKLGQLDIEEVPGLLMEQRVVKLDKSTTLVLNRNINTIDLSSNPITVDRVNEFANKLNMKANEPALSSIPYDLNLLLRNVFSTEADNETLSALVYPENVHVLLTE